MYQNEVNILPFEGNGNYYNFKNYAYSKKWKLVVP